MTVLSSFILGGGGRMKKLIQMIIVCGLVVVMGGTASGEDCGSKNNSSNYPNPIMCSEHIAVMKSFVDNLKNGNIDKVVNSIDYPIIFRKSGKEIAEIKDSEQFKKFYEYIFPKNKIKEIVIKFSNDNEYFWKNGRMMFGSGTIWFDLESGKVYTINHYDQKLITKMSGQPEEGKPEKEEVTTSNSTVNCSSEKDSLKRLTCYDNLPENLKNIKCSSISDSLKRLSCFESEDNSEFQEANNVVLSLKPSIIIPNNQKVFVKIVSSFIKKYNQSTNELQKSSVKRKRSNKLKEFFKDEVSISNWVGRVSRLRTTSSGNAELKIKLSGNQRISIGTTNNEFTDALQETTLIPIGSKLFDKVSGFSTGDKIRFSGNFIVSDEGSYINEQSITESGSMRNPEFLFHFSEIR